MWGLCGENTFITLLSFNLIRFDLLELSSQWWIADSEESKTEHGARVRARFCLVEKHRQGGSN